MEWSYLPLQDTLSQRSSVTCTLPSPTMGTDQEMTRNELCTGEWDYLQLGLTTLGRVYLLVYLSLLLLQSGDVERNLDLHLVNYCIFCRDGTLKTSQTRWERHHNTFTPFLHLVPFCQLCTTKKLSTHSLNEQGTQHCSLHSLPH